MASQDQQAARAPLLKRIPLAAAMAVVGLNVWTGAPLLALWIGSRVQGSGPPTMGAVFVVVAMIGLFSFTLMWLLGRLGASYDRLTGQEATVRQHAPWLRSMRAERPQYPGTKPTLTALERTLVIMVVVAFAAFEVWFFFFSGSPIGGPSGR